MIIEEVTVEGFWDCKKCGKKRIDGLDIYCPNCGYECPPDTTFYLPDDIDPMTRTQYNSSGNADWKCDHCQNRNSNDTDICDSCLEYRYSTEGMSGESFNDSNKKSIINNDQPSPVIIKKILPIVCITTIIISIILFIIWLSNDKIIKGTCTNIQWKRSIITYDYKEFIEEDEIVPSGANVISSRQVFDDYEWKLTGRSITVTKYRDIQIQKGTKQVPYKEKIKDGIEQVAYTIPRKVKVGTEKYKCKQNKDNRNGKITIQYCTRDIFKVVTDTKYKTVPKYKTITKYRTVPNMVTTSESYTVIEPERIKVPDYDTIYRYSIKRLRRSGEKELSGYNKSPKWPIIGKHANNDKFEEYQVSFTVDNKVYKKEVSFDIFKRIEKGQQYNLKISKLGNFDIIWR